MTNFDETLADRRAVMALMRELRDLQRAQDDDMAWTRALLDDIEERQQERQRRKDEITAELKAITPRVITDGPQHLDVPGFGRIQLTTQQPTIRIADHAAFMAWAKEHEEPDVIRPPKPGEESLDVNAAKRLAAAALEQGEVLPGVETVPEKTTIAVEWRLM